jgi:hypothetical protein
MSFDWNVKTNQNHVPSYQISGLPYCETKVNAGDSSFAELPRVSRWISISTVGAAAKIFFIDEGDANSSQYFTIPANTMSPRLEIRCTKVYFNQAAGAANSVSIVAGLTTINKDDFVQSTDTEFDWI